MVFPGFVVLLSIQGSANTKRNRPSSIVAQMEPKKNGKKLAVFQIFDNYLQC